MKEVSQKTGILMFFTLFAAYVTFAASWVGGSNLGPQIIQTYFGHEVSPVLSQVVNYTITIARVVANFLAALFLMKLGSSALVNLPYSYYHFQWSRSGCPIIGSTLLRG